MFDRSQVDRCLFERLVGSIESYVLIARAGCERVVFDLAMAENVHGTRGRG